MRRNVRLFSVGAGPILIALLLAAPVGSWTAGISPSGLGASPGTPVTVDLNPISTTLTIGSLVGTHLANPFWGINTGDAYFPKSQAALGQFLNSTPVTWIRLGGGDDGYDPTTQIEYQAPPSGAGKYQAVSELLVNFTWFKAWCDARTPHCLWMTYLPGEENNTQAATHVAQYFHNVLKFVPTYWEFGNEPLAWTHYGKNRTTWSTSDATTPSGPDYATMVHNYIAAVQKLFPSDKYLGIQNSCACNPSLITDLAKVDGPQLAGVAFHSYPWLTNSNSSIPQFFGALGSMRALPNTTAHMESLIAAGCSTCNRIPIDVGEYQAGPVPVHSPFAAQYSGAPFMAASVIQAIDDNVSTFTVYNIAWLFNVSNGAVNPEGQLYQRIFSNMTMGNDFAVKVTALGVGGVYALLVKNGTRESLLVVNTNSTKSLNLALSLTVFPIGLSGSYYTYSSSSPFPIAHKSVLLPSSLTLGPEEIALYDNF